MRIAVIGGTGMIGLRVVREAAARRHVITAISRSATSAAPAPTVVPVAADATDSDTMIELFAGVDVIVAATRPTPGDEDSVPAVTVGLLDAAAKAERRLLVVGGAGPLRTPDRPSRLAVDDPAFVAPEWRTIAMASVAQLRVCEAHRNADWTYVSPPAFIAPGEHTGAYRRGTTTLLVGPDGTSSISAEDFAGAIVDELETPSGHRHLTFAEAW